MVISKIQLTNGDTYDIKDTTYNFADDTNGFTVTPSDGTAQFVKVIPSFTKGTLASFKTGTSTTNCTWTPAVLRSCIDWAIGNIPAPMVFKGTLGTGGTITSLPAAAESNEGYTYKVITAGTYASQTAKIGDVFISNGSSWNLIPSGDEPNGTVTNIATGAGLTGGPITTSGTISHADTSSQESVTNTGKTYIQSVTLDDFGHVTGLASATMTDSNSWRGIYVNGTNRWGSGTSTKAVNFVGGDNVSVVYEANGTGSGQSGSDNYKNVKILTTGTAVTLNGTSKAGSTASFYAPTSGGYSGQVLVSNNSSAPSWSYYPNSSYVETSYGIDAPHMVCVPLESGVTGKIDVTVCTTGSNPDYIHIATKRFTYSAFPYNPAQNVYVLITTILSDYEVGTSSDIKISAYPTSGTQGTSFVSEFERNDGLTYVVFPIWIKSSYQGLTYFTITCDHCHSYIVNYQKDTSGFMFGQNGRRTVSAINTESNYTV